MKRVKFLSTVVVALILGFSACKKDAVPQGEDDAAVNVKGFAKLDPYGDGGGNTVIAFNWNSITASDFAKGATPPFNNFQKELCGGITIFRSQVALELDPDADYSEWTIDDVTLGTGNDPVYLWFEQPEEGACEGEDGIFYLLVRYKASNNVAIAFHIQACIEWCAKHGPISLQCEDLSLYYGGDVNTKNLGAVTQVRLGGYEFVEAPTLPHTVYFYKSEADYEAGDFFYSEEFFNGVLTLCPYFAAGNSQEDFIWHPVSATEVFDWAQCDGVFYDYLHDVQAEFFGVEPCQWRDEWQIVDGDSGLPVGELSYPMTGLTADVHLYPILYPDDCAFNYYTVQFFSDGEIIGEYLKVKEGTSVDALPFEFIADCETFFWADEDGNEVTFPYTVESDVDFYATLTAIMEYPDLDDLIGSLQSILDDACLVVNNEQEIRDAIKDLESLETDGYVKCEGLDLSSYESLLTGYATKGLDDPRINALISQRDEFAKHQDCLNLEIWEAYTKAVTALSKFTCRDADKLEDKIAYIESLLDKIYEGTTVTVTEATQSVGKCMDIPTGDFGGGSWKCATFDVNAILCDGKTYSIFQVNIQWLSSWSGNLSKLLEIYPSGILQGIDSEGYIYDFEVTKLTGGSFEGTYLGRHK